ncbi:hypothetical protein H5410_033192 [Solanum commersonii]|uniref:Uncharacterized protein n=1 Tax=Solanum commersonii TaxID=4109 RepID=A0A9J5YSD0_SOLCO|nr:hypothetical protein H5410_033192 [Solanum commersonii]
MTLPISMISPQDLECLLRRSSQSVDDIISTTTKKKERKWIHLKQRCRTRQVQRVIKSVIFYSRWSFDLGTLMYTFCWMPKVNYVIPYQELKVDKKFEELVILIKENHCMN